MITNRLINSITPILEAIQAQPFNHELAAGTLPREKFVYYLAQDALYLAEFSKALALTSARLPHTHHARQFMQFALEAIKAEQDLHAYYLEQYEALDLLKKGPSPTCLLYTHFLLKTASLDTVEIATAALLPCFWIYGEVGKAMAQKPRVDSNPYQNWIDLYSGEEFNASVKLAIEIVDELSASVSTFTQERMFTAFKRSAQLEWMFWDGAYAQQQWPIV